MCVQFWWFAFGDVQVDVEGLFEAISAQSVHCSGALLSLPAITHLKNILLVTRLLVLLLKTAANCDETLVYW